MNTKHTKCQSFVAQSNISNILAQLPEFLAVLMYVLVMLVLTALAIRGSRSTFNPSKNLLAKNSWRSP